MSDPQPPTAKDALPIEGSNLALSIHAPNAPAEDHNMSSTATTEPTFLPSEEDQAILAHIALAERNCSVIKHDGPNNTTVLPQFTPVPIGGFPLMHMSHLAQIFDHLDNKVLLAWLQVKHPKLIIQVFDHTSKEVHESAAVLTERIRANISVISNFIQQEAPPIRVSPPRPHRGKDAKEFPTCFLVHSISVETRDLLVAQRIWSTMDITIESHPFSCQRPPNLLFSVSGFTTSDCEIIQQTVKDVWSYEDNRTQINDILSMSEIPKERVHIATWNLINSTQVERLNFKIAGGLPVP
ncbi:uncharacterized protein EDB91DRAFT_1080629 [Suillus paluster]|uniref:uncharacterized protein n=1 Tax=Suillus paluster TaxID=48578 RepID=UPI001B87DEC9|nr:uncharacterized protein EDB91DRAFT_1080629 [Suillus paluster]KAG1744513.1 hypothetical protein EDB91DRAFT_1080629 [Suillus paluster]